MRLIPTLVHGVIDYIVGLVVIALPFVLGLQGATRMTLVALGIIAILYSLITDYELGAVRYLRVRFHLLLDIVFAVAMLALPSLLEFPPDLRWPNYLIGVAALVLVATTEIRATGTAKHYDNKEIMQ
ncbi:hypothetical protein JZX87_18920 [Agrobacterium sp. Ap1]|jgi:hypothetical protein|uniref:SPW repeat domain-containing protein n=1 Tax=Agrobacterium sp. Ap1 TaxID=2815337 RepID=UPI001A8DA8F8|nr:hypothetical protein [Agrobacterium sp. Ap1]MBO0143251.1 hypothetical protein [Agrobacterium sp. Ap1]